MSQRRDMDRRFFVAERFLDAAFRSRPRIGPNWVRHNARVVGRARLRRMGCSGFVLASLCLLAGCVETEMAAPAPQTQAPLPTNQERRPGVSPGGATVAMASFTGGPAGLTDRFTSLFDNAARTEGIVMADPGAADYFVRTYLNVVPENDGTAVTYVLDVFNSKKARVQRVEDQVMLKTKAADPWSTVDDHVLGAVAAKSAAELAAVLTNTPEAIVAASQANSAREIAASDSQGGRTIVAATPPVGPPSASGVGAVALH